MIQRSRKRIDRSPRGKRKRDIPPRARCSIVFLLAGIVILLHDATATPLRADSGGARLPQEVRFEQKLGAQVPLDATFRDEDGRTIALSELVGNGPIVLNLVYYECPMLCNMVLDGLVRSLRAVRLEPGRDFTIVTISFDPREDAKLAKAAKRTAYTRMGRTTSPQAWRFLTGDKKQIDRVCDAVGFSYQFDEQRGQYAHAAGVIVLTPRGVASRYLLGVEYPPRDVQLSLVEASGNKVGSLTDQIMLMCYQYDPTSGRYGLMIQNSLRVAGILTVSGLGFGIAMMLRRQRRELPDREALEQAWVDQSIGSDARADAKEASE